MDKYKVPFSKIKRRILSHVKVLRFILLGLALILAILASVFLYKFIARSFIGTSVGLVRDFVFPSKTRIATSKDRINILIMGVSGPGRGNRDEDMTDTMIVASVSTTTNKISLISIPRDIWIPSLNDKINSAYYYGKQKGGPETGMILAKSTVKEVIGEEVDYAVIIDFSSFKEVIDTIGGIEVDVKTDFIDNQYPIAGKENDNCNGDPTLACRYKTVVFQKGLQTMDGERVLEFVRSRHAAGSEGGDIARESRQQLVISGIIKKYLTPKIFTNLSIDIKILDIIQSNIKTDLNSSEIATLGRFALDGKSSISSYTIPDNLLFHPLNEYKYSNAFFPFAWVFIPANKDGTWTDLQSWVQSVLP